MNHLYLIIHAILITTLPPASAQKLQHQAKYRNFTVESETDSIYLVDITTYYEEDMPKTNCTFNITKDIHIKNIFISASRCSFDKLHCEFYESKKIRKDLKSFIYDENETWAPAVKSMTPKLDIPNVKKNIYRVIGAYVDENRSVTLYPNAINYFWRIDVAFVDHNDRNAAVLKFEYELISYVFKGKKLNQTISEPANTTPSKSDQLESGEFR